MHKKYSRNLKPSRPSRLHGGLGFQATELRTIQDVQRVTEVLITYLETALKIMDSENTGGSHYQGLLAYLDVCASFQDTDRFSRMRPDTQEYIMQLCTRFIREVRKFMGNIMLCVPEDADVAGFHVYSGTSSHRKFRYNIAPGERKPIFIAMKYPASLFMIETVATYANAPRAGTLRLNAYDPAGMEVTFMHPNGRNHVTYDFYLQYRPNNRACNEALLTLLADSLA